MTLKIILLQSPDNDIKKGKIILTPFNKQLGL